MSLGLVDSAGLISIEPIEFARGGGGAVDEPETFVTGPSPLDAIDWGTQLDSNTINVYFSEQGDRFDGVRSQGFDQFAIDAFMDAFAMYESYLDVTFNIVTDPDDADLKLVTTRNVQYLGYFNPPGEANEGVGVFANDGFGWDADGLQPGGFGFITIIHELGHALGLAHPHDTGGASEVLSGVDDDQDAGDFNLNQGIFTTMTYYDGWPEGPVGQSIYSNAGWQATIGALDIAVLQGKYGANEDANSGDTVYAIPEDNVAGVSYQTIWDTGGTDSITAGGSANAVIDLREATLQYEEGGGGFVSYSASIYGGYTIANGVVIENASGGAGDDLLIGNDADNVLTGGAGNDALYGGLGDDTLREGAGSGDDYYDGADGIDTISYEGVTSQITVDLTRGIAKGAGDDTLTGFENIIGGESRDHLRGDDNANDIHGGAGVDRLTGEAGDDHLFGGADNDAVLGNDGNDFLYGGDGKDVIRGGGGDDFIDGGAGGNILDGGAGGDELSGGSGGEFMFGRDGDDVITGADGRDNLRGQDGDDILTGGAGRDILIGGAGADRFIYETADDSTIDPQQRDTLLGFRGHQGDVIDLSAIDADITTEANDAFTIVDSFSGQAGELFFVETSIEDAWRVKADIDGDGQADIEILVDAPVGIYASDFVL